VTGAFGFVSSAAADSGRRSFAMGLAGPCGAVEALPARSSSSIKRRTVRTKCGTEISTPRSRKICAIRWTESPLRVRLQDLFLVHSQCVDLGLLAITAAFSAARDFQKIFGSGFEMIRISQGESLLCFSEVVERIELLRTERNRSFLPENQIVFRRTHRGIMALALRSIITAPTRSLLNLS
jgi:hypothetical protein